MRQLANGCLMQMTAVLLISKLKHYIAFWHGAACPWDMKAIPQIVTSVIMVLCHHQ